MSIVYNSESATTVYNMEFQISQTLTNNVKLNGSYNGRTFTNININVQGTTYTLLEDGGFAQWAYMFVPTEFMATTKHMYASFVNSMDFTHHGPQLHMHINVNYVNASDSAGGFKVQRNGYVVKFSKT